MRQAAKSVPPYAGQEPYLHFCFSEASGKKALALLERLYVRGVRVWYPVEAPKEQTARDAQDARMLSAAVTVIYLDEAFRNDSAAKSRLLTCQQNAQPIICINTDGGDSGLSIGLHADTVVIRPKRGEGADSFEQELLHTDGFSQELIGEPGKIHGRALGVLIRIIIVLCVLMLLFGLWRFFTQFRGMEQEEADTVVFSDSSILEAVREALGGGQVTSERLPAVTVLRLPGDTLPETLSDLSLLPRLETVEISQQAAKDIFAHPELFDYTIALYGGASE